MMLATLCAVVMILAADCAEALSSPGCAAKALAAGRRLERSIDVNGTQRSYILDVPEGVKAGAPVPLLFDFHGFGHSGAAVWKVSAFKDIAAREPFITVYPEGLPVQLLGRSAPGWEIFAVDGNRDLAFVRAMLDVVESSYCIDRGRVFSTGFSNGAFLSHLLACTMADRFAAVAPVGGGGLNIPCTPSRPVPIMIHHGRNDSIVKSERSRALRDLWAKNNGCDQRSEESCEWRRGCRNGADVAYCEDDGEHHWPAAATERIWSFFRTHPMPATAAP